MARIELLAGLAQDFVRIVHHLQRHEVADAAERVAGIVQALDVLKTHPRIGRPTKGGRRELIIGHDSRGYVALYRYEATIDTVFIEAIRAQKEGGYARD